MWGVWARTVWHKARGAKSQPKTTLEKHCAMNVFYRWPHYLWQKIYIGKSVGKCISSLMANSLISFQTSPLKELEKCTDVKNLVLLLSKWEFTPVFPETALVNCENLSKLLARDIKEKLQTFSRGHHLLLRSKQCLLTMVWLWEGHFRGIPEKIIPKNLLLSLLKMKHSSTLTYIDSTIPNSEFCHVRNS